MMYTSHGLMWLLLGGLCPFEAALVYLTNMDYAPFFLMYNSHGLIRLWHWRIHLLGFLGIYSASSGLLYLKTADTHYYILVCVMLEVHQHLNTFWMVSIVSHQDPNMLMLVCLNEYYPLSSPGPTYILSMLKDDYKTHMNCYITLNSMYFNIYATPNSM